MASDCGQDTVVHTVMHGVCRLTDAVLDRMWPLGKGRILVSAREGICFVDSYRLVACSTAGQGLWRVLAGKEPLHLEGYQCIRTAYRPPDHCQFTVNL